MAGIDPHPGRAEPMKERIRLAKRDLGMGESLDWVVVLENDYQFDELRKKHFNCTAYVNRENVVMAVLGYTRYTYADLNAYDAYEQAYEREYRELVDNYGPFENKVRKQQMQLRAHNSTIEYLESTGLLKPVVARIVPCNKERLCTEVA